MTPPRDWEDDRRSDLGRDARREAEQSSDIARRVVDSAWLTALSRILMVVVSAVVIPGGIWMVRSVFDHDMRLSLIERSGAQADAEILRRIGAVEMAMQRVADSYTVLSTNLAVQQSSLAGLLARIEAHERRDEQLRRPAP